VLLFEATKIERYLLAAKKIATRGLDDFAEAQPRLWDRTPDPAAVGVFVKRHQSFDKNLLFVRFLLALSKHGLPEHHEAAIKLLTALSTPELLEDAGRMLGQYLLAMDEAGVLVWQGNAATSR
jgi:hypothetical protein